MSSRRIRSRLRQAGIRFIGPDPEVIELLKDKTSARDLAVREVPVVPGSDGPVETRRARTRGRARTPGDRRGRHGGGGRGMRVVRTRDSRALIDGAARRRRPSATRSRGAIHRPPTASRCAPRRPHGRGDASVRTTAPYSVATRRWWRWPRAAPRRRPREPHPDAVKLAKARATRTPGPPSFRTRRGSTTSSRSTRASGAHGDRDLPGWTSCRRRSRSPAARLAKPGCRPSPSTCGASPSSAASRTETASARHRSRGVPLRRRHGHPPRRGSGCRRPGVAALRLAAREGDGAPPHLRHRQGAPRARRVPHPRGEDQHPLLQKVLTHPTFLSGDARTNFIDTSPSSSSSRAVATGPSRPCGSWGA